MLSVSRFHATRLEIDRHGNEIRFAKQCEIRSLELPVGYGLAFTKGIITHDWELLKSMGVGLGKQPWAAWITTEKHGKTLARTAGGKKLASGKYLPHRIVS
jgi:hypothetical protein